MYLEKQNGQSLLVQAIFFGVFFPGTGGVVFTILDVVEAGRYVSVVAGPPQPPPLP